MPGREFDRLSISRRAHGGTPRTENRDVEVWRFRIILDRGGPRALARCREEEESSVKWGARRATYPNGRGERSQPDTTDLNVPLALHCDVAGRGHWLAAVG